MPSHEGCTGFGAAHLFVTARDMKRDDAPRFADPLPLRSNDGSITAVANGLRMQRAWIPGPRGARRGPLRCEAVQPSRALDRLDRADRLRQQQLMLRLQSHRA
jgi:hypothetical protein